jgi:hypothetical protein
MAGGGGATLTRAAVGGRLARRWRLQAASGWAGSGSDDTRDGLRDAAAVAARALSTSRIVHHDGIGGTGCVARMLCTSSSFDASTLAPYSASDWFTLAAMAPSLMRSMTDASVNAMGCGIVNTLCFQRYSSSATPQPRRPSAHQQVHIAHNTHRAKHIAYHTSRTTRILH